MPADKSNSETPDVSERVGDTLGKVRNYIRNTFGILLGKISLETVRLEALKEMLDLSGDIGVVSGTGGEIIHLNPTALEKLGYSWEELKGKKLSEIIIAEDKQPELWEKFGEVVNGDKELGGVLSGIKAKDGSLIPVRWNNSKTQINGDQVMVSFGVDLTPQIELLAALETMEAKNLSGLLPICSSCKKIRDDEGQEPGKGEWVQLEKFIDDHSEAKFSHSLCPGCAKKALEEIGT
ncbi:MAG: PAS domain S-box protein [Patescibacteria group bacterium]